MGCTVVIVGQCLFEKQLRRLAIPRVGQVEINRLSVTVDGTEQTFLRDLGERMQKFGLELHPDKTPD